MKKLLKKSILVIFAVFLGFSFLAGNVNAEEKAENSSTSEEKKDDTNTSISITPVTKILQLSPSSVYDDVLKVTNNGNTDIKFEVYAAPYSYVYSEESDMYSLGFNHENSYTQITRWITVMDKNGNYVKNPTFSAAAGETVEVHYRISTPDSLPSGGQYAVLFAHTLSGTMNTSGIKTEASPGLVIYSRADGETITKAEFSSMTLAQTMEQDTMAEENGESIKKKTTINRINASAKIKNVGNVDFNAAGVLKVEGILGGAYYETPTNGARVSVIPESELMVSDEWEETPDFGLFRATWTVTAAGETQTIEAVFFFISPTFIIILIILLTIIIVWIIIMVRKRKERRSRFTA